MSSLKIGDLSDADLISVFNHLPHLDRLLTSEVCQRWLSVSRRSWLDVRHLDLSLIPGPNIAAIVRKCPNLKTVFAARKRFGSNELHELARVSLSSIKLINCTAVIRATGTTCEGIADAYSSIFSENMQNAQWHELVLANLHVQVLIEMQGGFDWIDVQLPFASFPASLKRLFISRVSCRESLSSKSSKYVRLVCDVKRNHEIERLQNLECLALQGVSFVPELAQLGGFRHLRELSLGQTCGWTDCELPDGCLPKLEVLFLNNVCVRDKANFAKLMTEHPSLRVLVLTGDFAPKIRLPKRCRYPMGRGLDPVPLLHVFVGRSASCQISFPKKATYSDLLKAYPISEPLQKFLETSDIAPIFEGVWLAEQIQQSAKAGADASALKTVDAASQIEEYSSSEEEDISSSSADDE